MARLAEEMAAEIGMELAVRLRRVSKEDIERLLAGTVRAEVEEVEEGLYQVTLIDAETGRPFLLVVYTFNPSWVSPVTYMGHGILDLDLLRKHYEKAMELLRASQG